MSREKAIEKHFDHVDCLDIQVVRHEGEVCEVTIECPQCDEIVGRVWSKDVDLGNSREVALEPDAIRYRINKMKAGGLSLSEIVFQLGMDGVKVSHMLQLVLELLAFEDREEVKEFICPRCETRHSRGKFPPGASNSYRCLKCGYVGPPAEVRGEKEDEPIPFRVVPKKGLKVTIEEDDGVEAVDFMPEIAPQAGVPEEEVSSFMEMLTDGEVDEEEIDHWVDTWHGHDEYGEPLHEFLGMSWQEYKRWVEDGTCLPELADERRRRRHESEESFAVELHKIWKCMGCGKDFMTGPDEKPVCPRCACG